MKIDKIREAVEAVPAVQAQIRISFHVGIGDPGRIVFVLVPLGEDPLQYGVSKFPEFRKTWGNTLYDYEVSLQRPEQAAVPASEALYKVEATEAELVAICMAQGRTVLCAYEALFGPEHPVGQQGDAIYHTLADAGFQDNPLRGDVLAQKLRMSKTVE